MILLKFLKKKKAVSPVIAALLLIAISVAAAVLTYSWVMTMISTQGAQSQTSIRIDIVEFSPEKIKCTVRNNGSVGATIDVVYIIDKRESVTVFDQVSDNSIPAGGTKEFSMDYIWEVTSPYTIRVATDTGFIAEATKYAPS